MWRILLSILECYSNSSNRDTVTESNVVNRDFDWWGAFFRMYKVLFTYTIFGAEFYSP